MKILYLGCHEILEFDEVRLFTEMGHEVFSLGGAYQNSNKGGNLRGEIPGLLLYPDLVAKAQTKEDISEELIDWADIILMTHNAPLPKEKHPQPWLKHNWNKFKRSKKPVIWRSIGQSSRPVEESLKEFRQQGLKIVRYSPREVFITGYVGHDAMIRFYADPNEYQGYTGSTPQVVNVSQALFGSDTNPSRGDHMSKHVFDKVVEGLPWKVFGPDNEKAGDHNGGKLSFEDLKSMLKLNRVYFYLGTRPAPYTLGFMEALMTGIPVVSIGPVFGNELYGQKTFEAHEILGDEGKAGFWSDSPEQLKEYCSMLLADHELAKKVGEQGRLRAIQYWGKDAIKAEWERFFKSL